MTLKQKMFIKKLPENNFNMAKTMRAAGYSVQTSNSGTQYNRLRKITDKKYFDEKFIRREYKKTLKEASLEKDLTNKLRTLEGMARIEALFTEKTHNISNNPDKLVLIYGNKDKSPTETTSPQEKLT